MADLLTDADVAARLGVGERWLADAARSGRVPCVKFGRTRRYREEHLAQIVEAFEQRPAPAAPRRSRKTSAANSAPDAGVVPLERKTPRRPRKQS